MFNIIVGLIGFLKTRFGAYIVSDFLGRTAGKATGFYKEYNARRAIKKGKLKGSTAELGEMDFYPAPVNVRIKRQNIGLKTFDYITTGHEIDLHDVFHKELAYPLVRYLEKAAEKCTPENPIVYLHLDEVIPEKYRDKYKRIIASELTEFFSAYYNDPNTLSDAHIHNGYYMERVQRIPVLVFEKSSDLSQLRVHVVSPAQIDTLPEADSVVIKKQGTWYGLNEAMPNGTQASSTKYNTHRTVVKTLKDNPDLCELFTVKVRTGRVVSGDKLEQSPDNSINIIANTNLSLSEMRRIPA